MSDLETACNDLAMLEFFPHHVRANVMNMLRTMCPHRRALKWLTAEVVNHVGKWPGPAELRGVLCSRFEPSDGVDQWCSLPGYTAEEQEAKHLEEHEQQKSISTSIAPESAELIRQAAKGLKRIG